MSKTRNTTWYSRILFLIVLLAVVWYIYNNVGTLKDSNISFDRTALLLSITFTLFAHLCNMFIWKYLAKSFGLNSGFLKTGKAWFLSRLGRFVPGKITILLVRFDLYKSDSKKTISAATVIEYIASLTSASLVVVVSILFESRMNLPVYFRFAAFAYLLLLLVLMFTGTINKVINKGLALLKKKPLEIFPSRVMLFRFLILYLIPILLHGLAFYYLINSVSGTHIGFEYYLTLTGVFYSAGLIGLAVLFAPSGIGVREGILFLILPLFPISEPVVIVSAIMIRLIALAGEILLGGTFALADRISRDRSTTAI